MRSKFASRLVFLALLLQTVAKADMGVLPVKEWRGELVRPHEGVLYWRTALQGFSKDVSSHITVIFYNIILQKNVVISQAQSPVDRFPREIWRVPSGKYAIDHIELIDGRGVRRTWQRSASSQVLIIVPRNMLSNLGIWKVTPEGAAGLKVQFAPGKNVYSEEGPKTESSIAAVVNGFTGIVQEVFGGKKVITGSDANYSDSSQLRSVATTTRHIAMLYRLNLLKDENLNKDIVQTLSGFDSNFRGCYSRALNGNLKLRGNIVLKVLISDKTGTMKQIRKTGGTLMDGDISDCLITELMQIPLPVHKNMIGELTFFFDMKQQ